VLPSANLCNCLSAASSFKPVSLILVLRGTASATGAVRPAPSNQGGDRRNPQNINGGRGFVPHSTGPNPHLRIFAFSGSPSAATGR
jgi:hypothetical protein